MGNSQNSSSPKNSSSLKKSNSPKSNSQVDRNKIQEDAKETLKNQLNNVQLKCEARLNDKEIHKKRMVENVERENPINKNVLTVTIDGTEQASKEQKNLSIQQVEECIHFDLISETNQISIKQPKSFVCGAHLQVKQAKEQRERIPMDLVCVIDDSGSMSGKKAQLVRKSLKYLLKIMNENDRVCLISFDSQEKILTPFLRNNAENKAALKLAIKSIVGRGSTNIEGGMEAGLWMIKNRKEKNPVTCLFLLSDGQDDSPRVDLRVQKLIQQYNITDNFIVNTYGYGADHDSQQMRTIAEAHKGGYYYIEDIKKVSDWFVLSISGLLSAVGEEVRIRLKQKNIAETNIKVTQVYGGDQLWVKQDYEKGVFEIYLPHLVIGDNKFLVFDCEFNNDKFKLTDQNRHLPIFEAEIEVRAVKQEQIIRKNSTLRLEFKETEADEIKDNSTQSYYEEMMVTYSRALGGLKIKQATDLISNQQDYTKAKGILEEYKVSMQNKTAKMSGNNGIKHLQEDLDDAIHKCAPKLFRKASFLKMEVVHCQRRNSITHCEDWNEEQGEIMNQFKNNDICLSDDSCSDDDGNDNDANVKHIKQVTQQNRKLSMRNMSGSDSGSDDEDNNVSPNVKPQIFKRRTSAQNSFTEDI